MMQQYCTFEWLYAVNLLYQFIPYENVPHKLKNKKKIVTWLFYLRNGNVTNVTFGGGTTILKVEVGDGDEKLLWDMYSVLLELCRAGVRICLTWGQAL